MIIKESVYQSPIWKKARELNNKVLEIAGIFSFEKEKKIPFIGKKKILFAEGLPDLEDKKNAIAILKEFKEKSKKYFYATISPTVTNSSLDIFKTSGFKKVVNHTILINLRKKEEELFQELEKKSARWGVKTAIKNNLNFELAKKSEISGFYQLYKRTTQEFNFPAESMEFLNLLFNSEISKLFLIKLKKEVVCGGLILIDKPNKYSVIHLTSASEQGLKLQAMPFLYWNIIKYSKSIGLDYFDMGGYDTNAKKGEKLYQINKFKENFGGNIVEQYIFSTNNKYPLLRKIMKQSNYLKSKYLKNLKKNE